MEYRVRVHLLNRPKPRVETYGPYSLDVAKVQAGSLQHAYETDAEIIDENGRVVDVVAHFVWTDD